MLLASPVLLGSSVFLFPLMESYFHLLETSQQNNLSCDLLFFPNIAEHVSSVQVQF